MGKIGFPKALFQTFNESTFKPDQFFVRLKGSSDTGKAFLYGLLLGSIGTIISFVWNRLFLEGLFSAFSQSGKEFFSLNSLLYSPILVTIGLCIGALYFQIVLVLTRSARKDLWSTFRIICYSQSATIFQIIPVIGMLISMVWSAYLLMVGFHKVHGMTKMRAFVLIVLPVILLMLLFAFLAIALALAGVFTVEFLKELFAGSR